MSIRGTCKNCERPDMSLPQEGICGTCRAVLKKYPAGPEQDQALAAVKDKAKRGLLKGPQKQVPLREKSIAEHASAISAAASAGKTKRVARTEKPASIFIHVCFVDDDIPLYRQFQEICKKKRRDPDAQILTMIEEVLSSEASVRA